MKTSLSPFIFTYTKYIYLKRRINFFSNYGTHKNKFKEWKGTITGSFNYEIISSESLRSVL